MHFSKAAVAALVGTGLVSASPIERQASTLSPCANITQQAARARAANATSFYFDGDLGYQCLNSMPFNATRGSQFALELIKYLKFHSTVDILKNPPKSYLSQPVDLLGGMQGIYQKATSGGYQSQYQFDTDITNLINSANDGHLSLQLCSTTIFYFERPSLASVSIDGLERPKVYVATDAVAALNGNKNVSDIVTINGEDTYQYLSALARTADNQDPDAQWNAVFTSQAKYVSGNNAGSSGLFAVNHQVGLWPDTAATTFAFSNGTTQTVRTTASLSINGFNYTNGTALYNAACLPRPLPTASSTSTASSTATATSSQSATSSASYAPTQTASPARYGRSQVRDPYNKIIGYYLDGSYNDTAVLFVPTFDFEGPYPDSLEATFAEVASTFVNQSKADGKTKMIIDVSGNPGGSIAAGFDLFRLFFPDLPAYSATRMRTHDSVRLMMKSLASINGTAYPSAYESNPFQYRVAVTPDQSRNFSSWQQLYGPNMTLGANMTNLYANNNFSLVSDEESPIRGYGGIPLNISSRPFDKENILIVSDGFCQSTCTTFTNLMTNSAFGGVKSVALGGRPINSPMQAMGGVRGAQSYSFSLLAQQASTAYVHAMNNTNTTNPPLSQQEIALLKETGPVDLLLLPLRLSSGGLNLRNSYNPNNNSLPLQFAYQAADCKLFYTLDNTFNPNSTWTAAHDAIWGQGKCVAGSTSSTPS